MDENELAELCPRYQRAVELIGRRWTGAIVRLLLGGHSRFHELAEGIPEMSDRMLSERLKELECEGIVERVVTPETPVRIDYFLTEKGRELKRAVGEISAWATRWVDVGEREDGTAGQESA